MIDRLGDRMKQQYEDRTRYYLPRRTYTIVRVDGKAFHTYTRHCERPWDALLNQAFDVAMHHSAKELQGCCVAYRQSDEVSFVLTDFEKEDTDAWFDGNVQKIASVAASTFTMQFNYYVGLQDNARTEPNAVFDARTFTIPDPTEVINYLIWRQKDCIRNSIQSLARTIWTHQQLLNKGTGEILRMLRESGNDWHNTPSSFRYGMVTDSAHSHRVLSAPLFTSDRERTFLRSSIPTVWDTPWPGVTDESSS